MYSQNANICVATSSMMIRHFESIKADQSKVILHKMCTNLQMESVSGVEIDIPKFLISCDVTCVAIESNERKQSERFRCYLCKQHFATDLIQHFSKYNSLCCGSSARTSVFIHLEKPTSRGVTLFSPVVLIFPRKSHAFTVQILRLHRSCKHI